MQTQRTTPSETREAYRKKYDAEIRQWESRLQYLKAESEKWSADTKLALHPNVEKAESAMNAAKAKWAHFTAAAEDKWEELKGDVEHAWTDVKAKIEGAYDAVKTHKPDRSN